MSKPPTQQKKQKKEAKPTATVKPDLKIEVVKKDTIPKLQRRHTGIYSAIADRLKELDGSDAIVLSVDTRPTAAGIQKYFKPLGYDVVSRSEKTADGKENIKVYISKAEKAE